MLIGLLNLKSDKVSGTISYENLVNKPKGTHLSYSTINLIQGYLSRTQFWPKCLKIHLQSAKYWLTYFTACWFAFINSYSNLWRLVFTFLVVHILWWKQGIREKKVLWGSNLKPLFSICCGQRRSNLITNTSWFRQNC